MDRWKSRGGKSQRREEQKREDQKRKGQKKKMQARENVRRVVKHFVFPEGRKVGSLKRRLRSHLAR
jgi:hypothetical protein